MAYPSRKEILAFVAAGRPVTVAEIRSVFYEEGNKRAFSACLSHDLRALERERLVKRVNAGQPTFWTVEQSQ